MVSERVLLDSPAVGLLDVRCASPVSGHGPAEWLRGPRLVLPQRGVFIWRQRQHSAVAHAGMALIPLALEEYTVAHPIEGGDWCLVLVLGDDLADRLQARLRVHTWARARACVVGFHSALAVRRLAAARGDELAVEEEALAAAGSVLASLDEPEWRPASPLAKAQVARAQAAIAGAPQHRWTLRELGQDCGCSPFQLARNFRRLTGSSLHAYLTRLRLAIALGCLADGCDDLTHLALSLGFSSHSHFTARFRQHLGASPSQVRLDARSARARVLQSANSSGARPVRRGEPRPYDSEEIWAHCAVSR